MRDEYKIQRQGKDYVLYPGLLNEAHEKYQIFSLKTEVLDAGDRPVVKATFSGTETMAVSSKGRLEASRSVETTGIGTAGRATDRKGPAVDAPLEMAETRAKARALRDAVNIGETSFEELPSPPESGAEIAAALSGGAASVHPLDPGYTLKGPTKSRETEGAVTMETLDRVVSLLDQDAKLRGVSLGERIKAMENYLQYPLKDMSEGEARGRAAQMEAALRHKEAMVEQGDDDQSEPDLSE